MNVGAVGPELSVWIVVDTLGLVAKPVSWTYAYIECVLVSVQCASALNVHER